jgi:lysophospholipase L1-like esterase
MLGRTSLQGLLAVLCLTVGCDESCDADHDVTMMGDSITWIEGYSDIVIREFEAEGLEAKKLAWNGTTAAFWANFKREYFEGKPPEILTILLGTNDAYLLQASQSEFLDSLHTIVWRARFEGACRVMVMTPPQRSYGPVQLPMTQRLLGLYSKGITDWCEADRYLECGPDLQTLIPPELLEDGIHPSDEGHFLIGDALLPQLRPPAPERIETRGQQHSRDVNSGIRFHLQKSGADSHFKLRFLHRL